MLVHPVSQADTIITRNNPKGHVITVTAGISRILKSSDWILHIKKQLFQTCF